MLAALRALNARFIHNFVTNDVASHDVMLHERFTSILPNGARLSRKDCLTAWATGFDPDVIVYWDYRDERIDVFGNTVALVSSTNVTPEHFPADDTIVRKYVRDRLVAE